MDRICDLPSFIVTGASASGKTTLIEQAIAGGYKYIPTHTTRPPYRGSFGFGVRLYARNWRILWFSAWSAMMLLDAIGLNKEVWRQMK